MRGYIELKRSLLENEINKNCKEKEKGRNSYGENNMLMENGNGTCSNSTESPCFYRID